MSETSEISQPPGGTEEVTRGIGRTITKVVESEVGKLFTEEAIKSGPEAEPALQQPATPDAIIALGVMEADGKVIAAVIPPVT